MAINPNRNYKASLLGLANVCQVAFFALVLALGAPKGSEAADSPSKTNQGLESKGLGLLSRPCIKELAGRVLVDCYTEVTQGLQADKYIDFVSVSTPATPSTGHVKIFSNVSANQVMAVFPDGTSQILGGLQSVTWGSITGTLSNQTDLQAKFTSVASDTTTLKTNINAVGLATGTIVSSLLASSQTWTGQNTYTAAVKISTTVLLNGAPGSNGQLLTSGGNGAIPSWTTAAAQALFQVTYGSTTARTNTTATSFTDTNLTASITPTSSSHRILAFATGTLDIGGAANQLAYATIKRGSTNIGDANNGLTLYFPNLGTTTETEVPATLMVIDSPATTSATQYTVQIKSSAGTATAKWIADNPGSYLVLVEIL